MRVVALIAILTAFSGVPARAAAGGGARRGPSLKSHVALVVDEARGEILYAKNADRVSPIASITKLMTAIVVLDAGLPPEEPIRIERADVDVLKHTRSRLQVGTIAPRADLLWVALLASENRAAAALARTYPGGTVACVEAMNRKARDLAMTRTRFADPTGLSSGNVSSAEDLARLVRAADAYPAIREATTSWSHTLPLPRGQALEFHNSNGLVSSKAWDIRLSKTGYINEAGRCLVMEATIAARPVIIVLLDSWGRYTRLGDANRIRHWMESSPTRETAAPGAARDPGAAARRPGALP